MKANAEIAKRFREVILDGHWIAATNFKDQLGSVTWEQATQKLGNLNSIAMLTFHIHYYIGGVLNVLNGGSLDIRDKYSFDLPPIQSQQDWEQLLNRLWEDAESFAVMVENMPDKLLKQPFVDEKYGNYQRNLEAIIEHSYYHLGQVVVLKKLTNQSRVDRPG